MCLCVLGMGGKGGVGGKRAGGTLIHPKADVHQHQLHELFDKLITFTRVVKQQTTRTLRAQISDKAAHYSHITKIRDLESLHAYGSPDHPQKLIICSLYYCRAIDPEHFIKI